MVECKQFSSIKFFVGLKNRRKEKQQHSSFLEFSLSMCVCSLVVYILKTNQSLIVQVHFESISYTIHTLCRHRFVERYCRQQRETKKIEFEFLFDRSTTVEIINSNKMVQWLAHAHKFYILFPQCVNIIVSRCSFSSFTSRFVRSHRPTTSVFRQKEEKNAIIDRVERLLILIINCSFLNADSPTLDALNM